MKTNEETVRRLFARRDAFYKRRKRQRAVLLACLCAVLSLPALILRSVFTDIEDAMMPEQAAADGAYVGTSDGPFSAAAETKASGNPPDRIVINELDAVPTRFMSRYISTNFQAIPAEEVLEHFGIRLDVEPLFDSCGLREEDREHGFYIKPDGTIFEQDFFLYSNDDHSKQLEIKLQSTNAGDIYMLSDYYDQPVCSYICGKGVYIFRWQGDEREGLFCELTYRDCVAIGIHMKNLGTRELTALIEYIAMQEPAFFEADIVP